MELVNEFTVKRPIEQTWNTLTDVPTITPCLPGAALEAIDGNTYSGVVRLKVGPITANFKGDASFIEKDDVKHRAVLDAKGRDTGNKGNAAAIIIAQLESIDANTTKVGVSTDLKITGKFAQFGRGAMQEISNKLLAEFVSNLEKLTTADAAAQTASGDAASTAAAVESDAAPASTANAATGASTITAPRASDNDNVLDLGKYAGAAMAKRFAPFAGGLLLLLLLLMRRRRH